MTLACVSGCQGLPSTGTSQQVSMGVSGEKISPSQAADVQIALARSLENRGDPNAALAKYLEALNQNPNRADACLRVAVLLDQQGKFAEAQTYYRRAQSLKPNNPDLYCNLGYSLYLQRRLPQAEAALRRAIALSSDHQKAHNNLGLVLARQGRDEEALAEFRKAGCSEAAAHSNLALGLALEERWSQARTHYEKALAADPGSSCARKGLQDLDGFLVRRQESENTSERASASVSLGTMRLPDTDRPSVLSLTAGQQPSQPSQSAPQDKGIVQE